MKKRMMKKLFTVLLSLATVFTMMIPAFAVEESEADHASALLQACGLTGGTFHANNIIAPSDVYIDAAGRLVIAAGTKKGGNLHLFANLGSLAGTLTDYTIEVKMAGIQVDDNWHYGFGINNKADNKMNTYFTVRSGAYTSGKDFGALMCYFNGVISNKNYMGKPETDFSEMSAANGATNTISVTYNSTAKTMSYRVNGVDIATLTNDKADMTLKDISLVVPHGTPETPEIAAFSYLRVLDAEGNVVYNNDFSKYNQNIEYIGTAIRFDDPSGIRVKSSISEKLRTATIAEDGFEVLEYGTLVAKAENYTDTAMTVGADGVQKAVSYSKADSIDKYFSRNDEKTEYTVALHGITNVNQEYAFRAYYIVSDGTNTYTVYQTYEDSVNLIKNLFSVAQQIKDADGSDYTDHSVFIDGILAQAAA